jgi:hypothetical protein
MKKFKALFSLLLISLFSLAMFAVPADAGPRRPDCPRPYGGYCRGPRWGWYGAKQPVATVEEARKRLEKYFQGEDVVVGEITEHRLYFKAEIKDKHDAVIDTVAIDKRTGRIRSLY